MRKAWQVGILVLPLVACGAQLDSDSNDVLKAREAYWRSALLHSPMKGASVDQAIAVFSAQKVEPSYDPRERLLRAREDISPTRPGVLPDIVTGSIFIECRFDSSERLESCTSKTIFTGP